MSKNKDFNKRDLVKLGKMWNYMFSIIKLKTTKRGIDFSDISKGVDEYLKGGIEWSRKDMSNFISFSLIDLYLKYGGNPPILPENEDGMLKLFPERGDE